jgi:hypothetical protein
MSDFYEIMTAINKHISVEWYIYGNVNIQQPWPEEGRVSSTDFIAWI